MANTAGPGVENPKETPVQSQSANPIPAAVSTRGPTPTQPQSQPPPSAVGGEIKVAVKVANSESCSHVTDVQKKIRRAERFGMHVQLSEEEKRNSRAERFGTGPGLHGSVALKKFEEQKRKVRAERFGLAQHPSDDNEAKKRARLARFAPSSKIDSVEEDKRKARAARFSQNQPTLSQASSELKLEKTAI